jgi:hypothetical protein
MIIWGPEMIRILRRHSRLVSSLKATSRSSLTASSSSYSMDLRLAWMEGPRDLMTPC